ncbi:MAG: hypothetical protein ACLGIC_06080 [Acidimicrobiia bacterium]
MELTATIDATTRDLADTVDRIAELGAAHVPAPVDALVLRVGAVNAEAIRQAGVVSVTSLEAVRGLTTVARTGASQLADAAVDATADAAGEIRRDLGAVGREAERVGDRIGARAEIAATDVVREADAATAKTARTGARTPDEAYERWSKGELYEKAQELDIEGRSGMSKAQLVRALRSA